MKKGLRIAVVGATGAVGQEFLALLNEGRLPSARLRLLASERSAGSTLQCLGEEHRVEALREDSFEGIDLAFFSAGASRSRQFGPAAVAAGAVMIDNSSAFRMVNGTPLVVPEVNFDAIAPDDRLVANPNCTAILLVMALAPLALLGRIRRVVVSTYQCASGGGASVMRELWEQTREVLEGGAPKPNAVPYPYAFNLFSHNTPVGEDGLNEEETKVIAETRKILGRPDLALNVTCVRVPVLRAHSESVTVEFESEAPSEDQVRDAIQQAPGVRLVDDRKANHFPMPFEASGQDEVLVGRIRKDPSSPNGICLFLAGDQLRKGAALNAVQIAQRLRAANCL